MCWFVDPYTYKEMVDEEGSFAYTMPDGVPYLHFPDGRIYDVPEEETSKTFYDRIERSKKVGRNLFIEEWELRDGEENPIYNQPFVCQ